MLEMEEKDVSILKRQISALQKENEDLKNENKRLKKENTDIVKLLKETTSYVKLDELIHNPGLEHIASHIFKYLDPKSLGQCRAVSTGWKSFIDNDKYWWIQVLEAKSMLRRGFRMIETFDVFANRMIWFPDNGYGEFENTVAYIKGHESLENLRRFGRFVLDYYCCFDKLDEVDPSVPRQIDVLEFRMQVHESLETPLHFAADHNRLDILNYLASLPTMCHFNLKNVDPRNLGGRRPHETLLGNAILKNQVEIVEFFMKLRGDKKIDFNQYEEDFGCTLFYLAFLSGNIEVIRLFLKHADELNINLNENFGPFDTPFYYSISIGQKEEIVRLLLSDSRIDVNVCQAFRKIMPKEIHPGPFEVNVFAMIVNSPRITLEDVDNEGNTIFHQAFESKNPEVIEVLIKEAIKRNITANINTKNSFGLTAIHCAFKYKFEEFNELDAIDNDDEDTCRSSVEVILKYSKEAKLDLEARCNKGKTPLHYLFETRNEVDVERFLKTAKEKYNIEFDLDARDNDGLTPRQMTETYEIRRRQLLHKNPHFIDEL